MIIFNEKDQIMTELNGYQIETYQQLLLLKIWGFLSLETANRQIKESKQIIEQKFDEGWALMVDLSNFDGCDDKCHEVYDQMNIWSAEHGQRAEAIIHNHSYHRIHVAELYNEALPCSVKADYFTDSFEALRWLNSLGYSIPNSLYDSSIQNTYAEHGGFSIEIKSYGLYCKFVGSWNNETTMAFSLALQHTIIENFSNKKWVVICDMKDWELAIPETRDTFESVMFWSEQHGLEAIADISDGLFKHLTEDFTKSLADECDSKIKIRNFSTIKDGINWLGSLGFNMES